MRTGDTGGRNSDGGGTSGKPHKNFPQAEGGETSSLAVGRGRGRATNRTRGRKKSRERYESESVLG